MSDAAWTVINSIRADGWCRSPCSIRKGCACADAIDKALSAEREACAKLVHDRLGADGYGVAKMIRARSNNSK
jgi:hypothetical protein